MPTAAENKKPPATAPSEIGAAQPDAIEIPPENAIPMTMPAIPPVTLRKHRLGEKLQQHVQPARADRHAQADFAGSFGDRHEQDIHDANAADDQGYRCDGGEQQRHDAARALGGFRELAEVAHVEVVDAAGHDAVAADERVGHLDDGGLNRVRTRGLNIDLVDEARQARLKIVGIGGGR